MTFHIILILVRKMTQIFHECNQQFYDVFPGIATSTQAQERSGQVLPPHWHERMEVWAVRSGEMTFTCDGDIFELYAGDVLIVNPAQVHSCRMNVTPTVIDCIIFDINALLTNRPGEIDKTLRSIAGGALRFQHIVRKNPDLYPLVRRIVETRPDAPFRCLEITGLIYQMLSILTQNYILKEEHPVPQLLQEINQLLEYIHKNFHKKLTLEELSSIACRSPSYLCRWFKEAVGESPMAYLTTIRINKAYELLSAGSCSVADAATAVGFSDLNTFTRQFRKRVGVLPSKVKPKQN